MAPIQDDLAVSHSALLPFYTGDDSADLLNLIAEVPELSGCAADGATRQAALTNVEAVIAE